MVDYGTILDQGLQYSWPMSRISGVLVSLPILNSSYIPSRTRLFLALMIAMIVIPLVPKNTISDFDFRFIVTLATEFLFGLIIGFIFQLIFQAFILGGQIIASQAGLGFATMVDPMSTANVPLISQLYMLLVSLVFLGLDGHLAIIQMIVNSFQVIPFSTLSFSELQLKKIVEFSEFMFSGAISMAIPAIVALLVVNMGFGVMSRAAPQLNIFSMGFSITLTLGIVIIYFTLNQVVGHVELAMTRGFSFLEQWMG